MNDAILRPKFLTVFLSYEDDGQLIIECCVRLSPVYNRKYLRLRRDKSLGLRMMIKCHMLIDIRNIFSFANTHEISPMLEKLKNCKP